MKTESPQNACSDASLWRHLLGAGAPAEAVTGFLRGLEAPTIGELLTLDGVGPRRAEQILVVVELARRLAAYRPPPRPRIKNPSDVFDLLAPTLVPRRSECLLVLALDARHGVIAIHTVSLGSATHLEVNPAEVFRPLIREGSAAGIVAHNHPSGDPTPSDDDQRMTKRLMDSGELLGIPILDHVIVAANGFVSLGEDTHGC